MRVGINAYFMLHPDTGSGVYLRNLSRALASACDYLELILYVPTGARPPVDFPNVRLRPVPSASGNLGKLLFEQLGFPLSALSDGCDVLHVPYFAPAFLGANRTVVTVHDVIPALLPAYRPGLLGRAYLVLVSRSVKQARLVLADSAWTKRDVVQMLGIEQKSVRVVHLAHPPECRAPAASEAVGALRERLGLPESYLLYYGGFDRRKAVDVLLSAYARVLAARLDVPPLVVAGTLPARTTETLYDPRPLASRLGISQRVHFVGRVAEEDKAALLTSAVLFVYPSIYEGFGLPPLEAMACGAPVIAARTSSIPEVCGSAALLVRPGDIASLAAAIMGLLDDAALRQELSRRGRQRASSFSWERTAADTLLAYESAWKGGP